MKKEDIHFGDLNRWLFGQTPPQFMIEVVIRTLLIYLFLLLVVRLMGKRMAGQITISELAVMLTLGAIVSPVMQLPDRGIFFGITALLCALVFQRGLNLLAFKDRKVEHITHGDMALLVKDGTLNLEELEKSQVTRQQLFSMLREKKIQNLGQVKRAYIEACGILSVYETDKENAGLPITPQRDKEVLDIQNALDSGLAACCNCGHVQNKAKNNICEVCHSNEWSEAYSYQTN